MKSIIAHVFIKNRYFIKSVTFENNKILFEDTDKKPEYVVVSGFVNAHTHMGDAFINYVPKLGVKELVGPGGYKQKMLEKSDSYTIINGMKKYASIMEKENIRSFFDFREGGLNGLKLIKSVEFRNVYPIILSRPKKNVLDYDEIEALLNNSHGIGLSSISDYDYSFIKEISKIVKEKKKIFAIHASERKREDINKILDLRPDFLVHMHKATIDDIKKVKEKDIPVVICPRSGLFFNIKMNMKRFIENGVNLALGTDNAMISVPSIRIEMLVASLIFDVDAIDIIKASTNSMYKFLPPEKNLIIFKSKPEEIVKNPYIRPMKIFKNEKFSIEL
ncbi:MAG: amidohydrolase family protein [Thermoplasmata archaeon]